MNLAETIREISREHVRSGGLLMGQNVEAVQNVHSTVPVDEPNVQIMPTTETAGIGMAIGAALSGRPVIHVVRFASFMWLQSSPLVNYAAKAKELWGYDCPLFVRVVSGDGLGPTHTGMTHSLFCHSPGLTVAAPCTPNEYREVWDLFQKSKQPIIVSEHRSTYENEIEPTGAFTPDARATFITISNARFVASHAWHYLNSMGVYTNFWTINFLSPFELNQRWPYLLGDVRGTKAAVVVDSAYEPCSVAEHLAYKLMSEISGCRVKIVGMEQRSSGVADRLENSTPTVERIVEAVKELL